MQAAAAEGSAAPQIDPGEDEAPRRRQLAELDQLRADYQKEFGARLPG